MFGLFHFRLQVGSHLFEFSPMQKNHTTQIHPACVKAVDQVVVCAKPCALLLVFCACVLTWKNILKYGLHTCNLQQTSAEFYRLTPSHRICGARSDQAMLRSHELPWTVWDLPLSRSGLELRCITGLFSSAQGRDKAWVVRVA